MDEQEFFVPFSKFLKAVWDRVSSYEMVLKYRPPWSPYLVALAKQVNNMRRKYRRTHFLIYLHQYNELWKYYRLSKKSIEDERREKQLQNLNNKQNIWKKVKPTFRPYMPSFRGLKSNNNVILRDSQKIVDQLADFFENHFSKPTHDANNEQHIEYLKIYQKIANEPKLSIETIEIKEVFKQWRKMSAKKSTDIFGISAFVLKCLPVEYMNVITILFNKCASRGVFPEAGKIAKIICLSKGGIYPSEDCLRAISLLPNLSKLFER